MEGFSITIDAHQLEKLIDNIQLNKNSTGIGNVSYSDVLELLCKLAYLHNTATYINKISDRVNKVAMVTISGYTFDLLSKVIVAIKRKESNKVFEE